MNKPLVSCYNPEGVEAADGTMTDCHNPFRVEDNSFFAFSQGRPTTANLGLEADYPVGVKEEHA